MKRYILLAIAFAMNAYAGNEAGGGGSGIVCPAVNGITAPAIVLDLYEAQILHGITVFDDPTPYQTQIMNVVSKLKYDFRLQSDFFEVYQRIQKSAHYLPPGVHLSAPSDLGSNNVTVFPSGCHLETIGYNDGSLTISTDVFSSLTETGKAAFFIHETLYKMKKLIDPTTETSEKIRPLTGVLLKYSSQDIAKNSDMGYVNWVQRWLGHEEASPNCIPYVSGQTCILQPFNWTFSTDSDFFIHKGWFLDGGVTPYTNRYDTEVPFVQVPERGHDMTLEVSNPHGRKLHIELICKGRLYPTYFPGEIPEYLFAYDTSNTYIKQTFNWRPECEEMVGGMKNPSLVSEIQYMQSPSGDHTSAVKLDEKVVISYGDKVLMSWPANPVIQNAEDANATFAIPFYFKSDLPPML